MPWPEGAPGTESLNTHTSIFWSLQAWNQWHSHATFRSERYFYHFRPKPTSRNIASHRRGRWHKIMSPRCINFIEHYSLSFYRYIYNKWILMSGICWSPQAIMPADCSMPSTRSSGMRWYRYIGNSPVINFSAMFLSWCGLFSVSVRRFTYYRQIAQNRFCKRVW